MNSHLPSPTSSASPPSPYFATRLPHQVSSSKRRRYNIECTPTPPPTSNNHALQSLPLKQGNRIDLTTPPLEGSDFPLTQDASSHDSSYRVILHDQVVKDVAMEEQNQAKLLEIKSKKARETANRDQFVQALVGASVLAIESIWGSASNSTSQTEKAAEAAFPLHWFVTEVLRRSQTSCSTLQVALYYLHKVRREIRHVVALAAQESSRKDIQLHHHQTAYPSPPLLAVDAAEVAARKVEASNSPVLCGRRMFLASLISASKFLQDRNFSNRAWAKISGLPVVEINTNERAFLKLMDFKLHIGATDFAKWTERLSLIAVQSTATSPLAGQASFTAPLRRHASEYPVAEPMADVTSVSSKSGPLTTTRTFGRARSTPVLPSTIPLPRVATPIVPRQIATPEPTRDSPVEEEMTSTIRPMKGIPRRIVIAPTTAKLPSWPTVRVDLMEGFPSSCGGGVIDHFSSTRGMEVATLA